ncbi:MAG: hypothetical protein M1833_000687 [Piccolia ochrophora]|nr:MAG: hypothetical protein M1833_000687 [Piccolia ochrophora]
MAAGAPPVETYTSPPSQQIHLYGGQQLSPISSASATPTNTSPKDTRSSTALPHLPLQTRQLRPPKSPMYRPAVLRPTERPAKPSPLTPPHSSSNSIDSLTDAASPQLSRRSTGESTTKMSLGRVEESDWMGLDNLGEVQGPPTKDHWKPDSSASSCDAALCDKYFSLFERRHHCRRCGNIFCAAHTPFLVPIDHHARFHPDGVHSRSCEVCWSDYKEWETARCNRSNSNSVHESPSTPTIGINGAPMGGKGLGQGSGGQRVGSVAGSVPRDWSWSTF